jgi:Leucine-rich repeat (LRR) protein
MKNNLVKEISGCLVGLQNLKSLDLSKNKVVTIPEKISNFPSLV